MMKFLPRSLGRPFLSLTAVLGVVSPADGSRLFSDTEGLVASVEVAPFTDSVLRVAVDAEGNLLVVGTPGSKKNNSEDNADGLVRVFSRTSNGGWALVQELNDSVSYLPLWHHVARFGNAVSMDAGTGRMVVGSPQVTVDEAVLLEGAAEVFRWENGQFVFEQQLCSDNLDQRGTFGESVTLEGGTIVVADRGQEELTVFKRDESGQWMQEQKLKPAGENPGSLQLEVALEGNTLLVGDSRRSGSEVGRGIIYQRVSEDAPFEFVQELLPSESDLKHAYRVALAAGTAVMVSQESGKLAVFEQGEGTWMETASFVNPGIGLGASLSLSEDGLSIFAGAPEDSVEGFVNSGRVLAFHKGSDGTWLQSGVRMREAVPADNQFFGYATAVVGGEPEVIALSANLTGGIFGGVADQEVHRLLPNDRAQLYVEAPGADPNTAIFRYKVHLYGPDNQDPTILIPTPEEIAGFYGASDRAAAAVKRQEVLDQLVLFPSSRYFGNLLLDIVYDQAVAETIPAHQALETIDLRRINPPGNASEFVIEDEIASYQTILQGFRLALSNYTQILDDPVTAVVFEDLVPTRPLIPAVYDDEGVLKSVIGGGSLIEGFKDADFFLQVLGEHATAAADLARLHQLNGQLAEARQVIADARQFSFIYGSRVRSLFQQAGNDAAELELAVPVWRTGLESLAEAARQVDAATNPLGFDPGFLVLYDRQAGESPELFHTFDILIGRVNNVTSSFNYIQVAEEAQDDAVQAYAEYRGGLDGVRERLQDIEFDAVERLVDVVGASYIEEREVYDAIPGPAKDEAGNEFEDGGFIVGSELWQQFQNIRRARIAIQTNGQKIQNLLSEVRIEVRRNLFETQTRGEIADVQLAFANQRASLEEMIGKIEAAQAAAEAFAEALNPGNWGEAIGNAISGGVNVGAELGKGQLRAHKERLAGLEQVAITSKENDILNANSQAKIQTILLDLNTLRLDSQDLAITLNQELGHMMGLYRERQVLENRIGAYSETAERRFQGDPVHRLRVLFELNIARRKIDIAQQFTFYLARSLEYKWNEPFNDIMAGSGYEFDDIFRLRNAQEIGLFVDAMQLANSNYEGPTRRRDVETDRFSLRKHAFNLGDDVAAFRERLAGLVDGNTLSIPFSTVRDAPDNSTATFFLGPRGFTVSPASGRILTDEPGIYADQIKSFQISIPGTHTTGELDTRARVVYGGTSFIRSRQPGTYPDFLNQPDVIEDEITTAPIRIPSASGTAWQYRNTLDVLGRVTLENDNPIPGVNVFEGFRERSVAASGWELRLTINETNGTPIVRVDEIDDIVLHIEHTFIPRQSN